MSRLTPETRRLVRPKLRDAADAMAQDARKRASWSTRIPGTVRVSTSFRVDREGVTLRAGGRNAPHARPYENQGQQGTFRHPVYARDELIRKQWTWVTQASRPFLWPAVREGWQKSTSEMAKVLSEAAANLGFQGA